MTAWIDYGSATPPPSVMDRIPSGLHADIFNGVSTVDVSSYINAALQDYRMVRLPIVGRLCVGSPVVVPSGGALIGYNYQCTIKALPNFGDNPVIRNGYIGPTSESARDKNITLVGFRVDGSLHSNHTATEFGHGVKLHAVDGCDIDLEIVDTKGDGLCILFADYPNYHIPCSNITGRVRTRRCDRQGVSVICAEQVSLEIFDTETRLMSLCIEPDRHDNIVRNCSFRVHSIRTGQGSDVSGGFACVGDGTGSTPTNILIDFNVHEAGGYGGLWRDTLNLTLRGSIFACARGGLVGLDGGFSRSTVFFDGVRVQNPGIAGFTSRETPGSIYDGSIYIEGAAGAGAKIENARDGVLQLRVQNCREEGLYLRNCVNMTFPNLVVDGNNGNNVWIAGNSHGNRFPGMRSTSSNSGYGFIEENGCNNNKAYNARVEGNAGGNISIFGSSSYVLPEH
jgi:hypothetical protein